DGTTLPFLEHDGHSRTAWATGAVRGCKIGRLSRRDTERSGGQSSEREPAAIVAEHRARIEPGACDRDDSAPQRQRRIRGIDDDTGDLGRAHLRSGGARVAWLR